MFHKLRLFFPAIILFTSGLFFGNCIPMNQSNEVVGDDEVGDYIKIWVHQITSELCASPVSIKEICVSYAQQLAKYVKEKQMQLDFFKKWEKDIVAALGRANVSKTNQEMIILQIEQQVSKVDSIERQEESVSESNEFVLL